MSDDIVVKVDHVSMRFNLSSEKVDNMKEYFSIIYKQNLRFWEELFRNEGKNISFRR